MNQKIIPSSAFVLAFLIALLFLYFRKQPWEYLLVLTTGLFLGTVLASRKKIILIVSIILTVLIFFLDITLKSWLDQALRVNTVGTIFASVFLNTLLFLLFWAGFYAGTYVQRSCQNR